MTVYQNGTIQHYHDDDDDDDDDTEHLQLIINVTVPIIEQALVTEPTCRL